MINLKNTYIENKPGELRDLWVAECKKQGFAIYYSSCSLYGLPWLYVYNGKVMGCTLGCVSNKKQLTMSDLKPKRTKTEFVRVETSEAKDYHTDELFFQYGEEKIEPLKSVDAAFFIINQHKLVRKVEREVIWQDEVNDFIAKSDAISLNHKLGMFQAIDADSVECCEFIRMCHLVAGMTVKPE